VKTVPRWLHVSLLLFWTLLGLGLRFINLAGKPLWTDEFSTIVFSLGNSFSSVPLDQVITAETLLQPLKPPPTATVNSVIAYLLQESNHPPLYFVLSHFWLMLFPTPANGLVSAWSVRSLPALIGAITIPATFVLGWLTFRSRVVAQTAAALMAVSPFGIYLAQEARHYTLPILEVLISLCCLIVAARYLRDRSVLPLKLCLGWIGINGLGIATHYFFAFTLGAEAIVIAVLGLVQSWRESGIWHPSTHWRRVWLVALGTVAAGLVWWPVLQNIQEGELTRWIYQGERSGWAWLNPIGQAIAGWITMLYLLPVQIEPHTLAVLSAIALGLLTLWTLPKLYRGLQVQSLQRNSRLGVLVLGGFVAGAIVLFFSITYFFDTDLAGAFRYNFVFFPGVVVLIGAGLGSSWDVAVQIAQTPGVVPPALLNLLRISNRKTVILVWLLSVIGAIVVVTNLGYQKPHRPDLVAAAIQQASSRNTVLISIPHHSHAQAGRLMGVALSLQQLNSQTSTPMNPLFLLAHAAPQTPSVLATLRQTLNQQSRPLDLWLINYQDQSEPLLNALLDQENCAAETRPHSADGYRYRLYHCSRSIPSNS
jgi:uncharacterized membrane protein